MYKSVCLFLFTVSFALLKAQSEAVVFGHVKNEKGVAVESADVMMDGTLYSVFTDAYGYFEMKVEQGTYELLVNSNGFDEFFQELSVSSGEKIEVSIQLISLPATQLNEAVVVGQTSRETESALLNEQRKSIDIKQAIGVQELSRKGVGDVATAVTKTTGVAKQEGVKNVFVRGLGDRYNSSSLNGLPLPSEDPEYKNISLEFFTTDIIQNISINKTFGASIYGDVAGANIDISSKELEQKSYFSFEAGNGYNSNLSGNTLLVADGHNYLGFPENGTKVPISSLNVYDFETGFKPTERKHMFNTNFSLIGGGKFKIGEKNSLSLFGVVLSNSEFYFQEGVVRQVNSKGGIRQDMTVNKSGYTTTQTLLGNLKYKFGTGRSISLNSLYIHDNHQTVGDYKGFTTRVNDNDFADNSFIRRQQMNSNHLFVNQLLTEYKISERFSTNLGVAYNMVRGSEPDRKTNSYDFDYKGSNGHLIGTNSAALNHRFFSELEENDWTGKLEFNYKFNPKEKLVKSLKLGGNFRYTDRKFEYTQFNFHFSSPVPVDINHPDELFSQTYLDLGRQNGGFDMITGRGKGENALDPFYYLGERAVVAGYAQLIYPFSKNFTALIGARFESVKQTVDWDTNLSSSINDLTVQGGKIQENFILPSLNLKYALNDDNILRFAASQTYTLPQFKEVALFLYEDVNFSSFGNPYLEVATSFNFDLKYDWYLSHKGEIFSIGGFYKLIQNPINRIRVASAANELSYVNTGDAFATGAELELRKIIFGSETDQIKQNLSFGLNASYLYTEQKLVDVDTDKLTVLFTNEKDRLEGASPLLINTDLSYHRKDERTEFTSTVVFNYFYDKIFSIGTSLNENIIEKSVPTLDFVNKIQFKKSGLGLSLSVRNILNPEFRLTQETINNGQTDDALISSYKKGIAFSFGIQWTM